MGRWFFLWLIASVPALAADTTPEPLSPGRAVKAMILPEGFQASVFAAEPDIVQPISFCLDARGRLFVAEAFNYGAWQPTGKDRIVILEDKMGRGRADSCKVFYEGLNYITGIEVGFGGVWVMSPPNLYFIPMREGDDKPSGPPEAVFDGFGYKESRHNLANGFTWGPDGWLYFGHGRTSPSEVGKPGVPADQRIHCDGGVCRIHPTKKIFENFADGTTNPWGVDFDDYGQCFVSNCVNPHLFHMVQGGHYEPWRNRPASAYAYGRLPTIADHLHYPTGKPNEMRGETQETLSLGGGHAHCGTLIYLGDSFPSSFRNTVFMCNVHGRRINNDRLHPKGSGYTASHGKDFMISGDPWFMGVTLRTGADGSVFVSDWSDTGECHTLKPNTATGRIYKLSYGADVKPGPDLTALADADLVKLQMHRNEWHVRQARRLLQERSTGPNWHAAPVHVELRHMLADVSRSSPERLRALWALHATNGCDAGILKKLLKDDDVHVRGWAVQLLTEPRDLSTAAASELADMAASDSSQRVRLFLASALQRLPIEDRWGLATNLAGHAEDAADANLPLMYWYGIEPLVPSDPGRALTLAQRSAIPLIPELIARRTVDHALTKRHPGRFDALVACLGDAKTEVMADLIRGTSQALQGTKSLPMPAGWPAVYRKLRSANDANVRLYAMKIALIFNDGDAITDLMAIVDDKKGQTEERCEALQALIDKSAPADLAVKLQQMLADPALRPTAIRGLAVVAHPDTPRELLRVYAGLNAAEKQDAIATLASRKNYARELLKAIQDKSMQRSDMSAYIARQLSGFHDKQIDASLREVWGDVRTSEPQKLRQLAQLKKLLNPNYLSRADLANGRNLFSKSCQQCHKLHGEGGTVGPDLTGANRDNLDYLLSNLIDPSAEVSKDYRMSIVEMADGRKITGIVVDETPARLVLQTASEKLTLSRTEIESVQLSELSIMPEKQLDPLTNDQIRDLIGFLMSKTSRVPSK